MITLSMRLSTGLALATSFIFLPPALSLFSEQPDNIAIYWGQNSYGHDRSQQRLSHYCTNGDIDIVVLAFMNRIKNITNINFANSGNNCTLFPGTTLMDCPQIEEDIQTCQRLSKTVMLSIGGDTYTEGGFSSPAEAMAWADIVWAMFGPIQSSGSVNRPFGSAVVDGFDMNLESPASNMPTFAARLRANIDIANAIGPKIYYLSAAPQCPFPDLCTNDILVSTALDFVMVQFYNNVCGVSSYVAGASTQNDFTFSAWHNWAHSASKSRNTKVLLGILGNTGGGAGYESGSQLSSVISFSRTYSTFGGVMIWDMSQVYENPKFLSAVASDLGRSARPTSAITAVTSASSILTSKLSCGGAT